MLRLLFILAVVGIGIYYAILGGPFYALLFYIWNAYFRPEDWVWGDAVRSLRLSYVIALYMIAATVASRIRYNINGRLVLFFLFCLHSLLSCLMSNYSTYSFDAWIAFLKNTIIIVYISTLLITDFHKFHLFILVVVLSLGLEATKQGWYYLIVAPGWENTNKIPFLGDNNVVAVGMLMLIPLIGFLAQTTKRIWAISLYWFMFVGVLYRALSTHSRGGFLTCIALGMAYLIRSQQKMRVLLGMIIVVGIVLPALPDEYWDRMHSIKTVQEEDDNEKSMRGRLHVWEVAIKMAQANPWFGVGYNAYNPSYDAYDFSGGYFGNARSVHSSFFAVLAELGFLGTVLYTLVLISAFHSCYRVTKLAERNPALTNFGKGAVALERGLVAFLIGGCFVPIAYNEMVWHYIGLTMVLERLAAQAIVNTRSRELSNAFVQPTTVGQT